MKSKKHAAFCALLMALAAAAAAMQPVSVSAAEAPDLTAYANEVVRLVNAERQSRGLAPVTASASLNAAAQIRAGETTAQFSHTRPDGRGSASVLDDLAIEWRTCGENIAYGYPDAAAVMDGWMHSDGHRANILNANFESIGVGVTEAGGMIYCTQIFTGGADPDASLPTMTSPDVTITIPEPSTPDSAAPAPEITPDTSPCIGDACAPAFCIGTDCPDTQTICIGGNTCIFPVSGCSSIGNLLCVLTGKC